MPAERRSLFVPVQDFSLRVWDVITHKCLFTKKNAHKEEVDGKEVGKIVRSMITLPTSPDAAHTSRIATGGRDMAVRTWVWDFVENQLREDEAPRMGHSGFIRDLAVAGVGYLVSASCDRVLHLWSSSEHIYTLKGHTSAVNAVAAARRLCTQPRVSAHAAAAEADEAEGSPWVKRVRESLAKATDTRPMVGAAVGALVGAGVAVATSPTKGGGSPFWG